MSKNSFDVCDYCCEWVSDHRGAEPAIVMEDYPKMMRKVLRHEFGLPKRVANEFIETACEGNWLKLHDTDVERYVGSDVYSNMILDELFYISDRISFDRIFRVQWLYRRLVRACRIDDEMKDCLPVPEVTETLECVCDGIGSYGKMVTIHVMECPEFGRTYDHVNGDYERCPHCGTKFRTLEER